MIQLLERSRKPAETSFYLWLLLLCFFAASGMLISCSSQGEADKKQAKGPGARPPVPVLTAIVQRMDVPVQMSAIGTVESFVTVQIRARVGGELIKVAFKEGDDVKQGDLLFQIDPRPLEAALNQAQAELAKAKAQAVYAKTTNARFEKLLKEKVVSPEEYDQARSNLAALEAAVQSSQAAVEQAKVLLSYTTIRSPVSGRAGSLRVDEGNLIKADDTNPLVTINQIDPIYVSFSIPEQDLPDVRKHMAGGDLKLEAMVPNEDSEPASGTLTFVENTVDRATGTIQMKGTFANRDRHLWPGQFVNVRLTLDILRNAVVVPSQALQTGQSGQYVFVVKPDHTAEVRQVETGPAENEMTVIQKGLQGGEQVVTDGQMRLAPGSKVQQRGDADSDAARAGKRAKGGGPKD